MDTNLSRLLPESHGSDFHQERRRKFKERMQLSLLLSRRPRKAIAEDMDVSESTLCDWLNLGKRDSMPAHFLDAWTREVGKGVLQWAAKENGLGLVETGETGPSLVTDAVQLLALISVHQGELMAQILQAQAGGIIGDAERSAIWPGICTLIRELEAAADCFRPRMKGVA